MSPVGERHQTVFAEGPGSAQLMFVGEQPGDQDWAEITAWRPWLEAELAAFVDDLRFVANL
jgi:hypothetical protein